MKSAQSRKDKFETLGYFGADISSTLYTSELAETGEMAHKRKFDKILLLGFRASSASQPAAIPVDRIDLVQFQKTGPDIGVGQSDDRDQPAVIPVDQIDLTRFRTTGPDT